MEIKDILKQKNYEQLHVFLSNFLFSVESKVNKFLEDSGTLGELVKKGMDIGNISTGKLLRGDKEITPIGYGLHYTFFKDVEDYYGQRPNDVALGFVILFSDFNDIEITRDIVSEFGDVDYDAFKFQGLTNELEKDILEMEQIFIQVIKNFLEKSLGIDIPNL
ncbi:MULTISPECIES: hypothetical protein [unclassified Lysinibacillus]|uniref:hypothetical protein n=1 Tax=unclassified Lysinibacillus TaxID=2636778 RepID=UPI002553F65D|nr:MULTISPECIES: hypothetical protein [unclassified Lysinibacillus]MDM5247970.1 hypothetical protein [Lysinibacillus sp. G4S2]